VNTVTDKHDTRSKSKVLQNSIVVTGLKTILQYEEPQAYKGNQPQKQLYLPKHLAK
jgi:hypothetical protein